MKKEKSKCCNAEIEMCGGGYDGEEIVPIEEFCKKCGQVIRINGAKQDIVIPNKNNE